MNNNLTVGFRNRNQVVLFTNELQGQISDGMWENARPRRHYELPCQAVAFVATDDTQLGRNFPARTYNFSGELVEYVGDRMVNMVKMSLAFPTVPVSEIFDMETNPRDTLTGWLNYSKGGQGVYWKNKIDAACVTFGVETVDQLIVKLETGLATVTYGMKELLKDLNDMKKCWRIVR